MSRFLMILVLVLGLAVFGCGEQASDANGDGDQTEDVTSDTGDTGDTGDTSDTGDVPVGLSSDIDFQCPELAVGQWVEYGVSDETGKAIISVVAEEEFDGVNCLWVQIEVEDQSAAPGAGIPQPERAPRVLSVAGCAEIDGHVLDRRRRSGRAACPRRVRIPATT